MKIGYQIALKLLRAGAETIILTRFPVDAARRLAAEPDADELCARAHVYGFDLRHTPSVEALCAHLVGDADPARRADQQRLPDGAPAERLLRSPDAGRDRAVVEPRRRASARCWPAGGRVRAEAEAAHHALADGAHGRGAGAGAPGLWQQRRAVAGPAARRGSRARQPPVSRPAASTQDLQQVDLRDFNSWRMTLADVPTAELLEVHLVNAVAPFVLNARLKPLLAAVPTRDAHVVNVSAMEGQFYRRFKTDKHPHTNMAKAALNMMTRTSAADYVRDGIHMNAVDTGWVTDEDPAAIASRKTEIHGFHPPLDIVDGAARVLDPVFDGYNHRPARLGPVPEGLRADALVTYRPLTRRGRRGGTLDGCASWSSKTRPASARGSSICCAVTATR